jgi:hypothetical protein
MSHPTILGATGVAGKYGRHIVAVLATVTQVIFAGIHPTTRLAPRSNA